MGMCIRFMDRGVRRRLTATAMSPLQITTAELVTRAAVTVHRAWRRKPISWGRRLVGDTPMLEAGTSAMDDALAPGSGCDRIYYEPLWCCNGRGVLVRPGDA